MKVSLKSILFVIASVLGIVAFCMLFIEPLKVDTGSLPITIETNWKDVYFGDPEAEIKGATGAAAGFILMGLGGLFAFVLALLSGKRRGIIGFLLAIVTIGLVAAGAVLVFCTKTFYLETIKTGVELIDNKVSEMISLGVGPIVGGLLGCLAALASLFALFVPAPKKKKR